MHSRKWLRQLYRPASIRPAGSGVSLAQWLHGDALPEAPERYWKKYLLAWHQGEHWLEIFQSLSSLPEQLTLSRHVRLQSLQLGLVLHLVKWSYDPQHSEAFDRQWLTQCLNQLKISQEHWQQSKQKFIRLCRPHTPL